jgi:hypothetical protein
MTGKGIGFELVAPAVIFILAGCGGADQGAGSAAGEEATDQASEASSSGCHVAVSGYNECITVIGTGVYVDTVTGTASGNYKVCSQHHLTVTTSSGSTWLSVYGPSQCLTPGNPAIHVFSEYKNFPDGSTVCVQFGASKPCEGIHK